MSSLYHKYFFALPPRYQTDLELKRKATIYAKESLSSVRVIILIIIIITSDNDDKWSLVIFLISCDQFKLLYFTIHLRFSWGTLSTQESPKTSGHPCLALSATLVDWWVPMSSKKINLWFRYLCRFAHLGWLSDPTLSYQSIKILPIRPGGTHDRVLSHHPHWDLSTPGSAPCQSLSLLMMTIFI